MLRGLLWFLAFVVLFIFIKDNFDLHPESWLAEISEQPLKVYLIFLLSEIVVGIIPPEIFMVWSMKSASSSQYVLDIFLLSSVSYLAGIIGYYIGMRFHKSRFYDYVQQKLFGRYEVFLRKFGGFLVIVAALTPLPFSGVCMLVGSVKFNFKKFLLFAGFRFVRFGLYSYLLWQASLL